jgi:hypothetical protein
MPRIFALPMEVLERILDEVVPRSDLLALALTCTCLRDVIIPGHLSYRAVITSVYMGSFFETLIENPILALRVYELTIINERSPIPCERRYGPEEREQAFTIPLERIRLAIKTAKHLRRLSIQSGFWHYCNLTSPPVNMLLEAPGVDHPMLEHIHCNINIRRDRLNIKFPVGFSQY